MSLNDPRWGNQGNDNNRDGNQGPPDLEEMWRDFNRRLSSLFGGKRGGSGGGGGEGGPAFNFSPLRQRLWCNRGAGPRGLGRQRFLYRRCQPARRGAAFRQYVETTEPGLRWRMPFPIESHELVNLTGVRTVEVGYRGSERNKVLNEALMLTDDENIINIQFAVQYILNNPENYLFNNREPDESVIQAAETAMREIVGKNRMDFVLYEGRRADRGDGAHLDAGHPRPLRDRYPDQQGDDAERAAARAGAGSLRRCGEGRTGSRAAKERGPGLRQRRDPRARGTSSRLMQESEGYRSRVVAQAEGDAARFTQVLTEYAKAPEVTRRRIYLETMQEIYSNTTKIMVDARGNNNLTFLPLDKLLQQAGAASPASASTAIGGDVQQGASAEAAQNMSIGRSTGSGGDFRDRDSMRNRDGGR